MTDSSNLQQKRWTDDPAQVEKFVMEVMSRIDGESKFISRRYNVGEDREDLMSKVKIDLLQQMHDKESPFDRDSLEEAVSYFLVEKEYWIREHIRPEARKIAEEQKKLDEMVQVANGKSSPQITEDQEKEQKKQQKRQAEIFAYLSRRELVVDEEAECRRAMEGLPNIIDAITDFTPGDSSIFVKVKLREMGIPESMLGEAAQKTGVPQSELLEYYHYRDEHGHDSPKDRKAKIRADAKVKKVITSVAKLLSLLGLIFVLSLTFLTSVAQERSEHQKALAIENRPIYLAALKNHQ